MKRNKLLKMLTVLSVFTFAFPVFSQECMDLVGKEVTIKNYWHSSWGDDYPDLVLKDINFDPDDDEYDFIMDWSSSLERTNTMTSIRSYWGIGYIPTSISTSSSNSISIEENGENSTNQEFAATYSFIAEEANTFFMTYQTPDGECAIIAAINGDDDTHTYGGIFRDNYKKFYDLYEEVEFDVIIE